MNLIRYSLVDSDGHHHPFMGGSAYGDISGLVYLKFKLLKPTPHHQWKKEGYCTEHWFKPQGIKDFGEALTDLLEIYRNYWHHMDPVGPMQVFKASLLRRRLEDHPEYVQFYEDEHQVAYLVNPESSLGCFRSPFLCPSFPLEQS